MELYLHSPMRLHGIVLSQAQGQLYLYPVKGQLCASCIDISEVVSKSFRTGRLERELQMVQLSATKCICESVWCVLKS
jgi:hypothetical protein